MSGEQEKPKEETEVKPVIPDDEEKTKPPEGFTEEDWADLSDAEKEGILDKGEEEEEKDLSDEALTDIAGEEEKPAEEKPKEGEKPKEEAKPLEEKPKEEAVKPPETPPAEEKKPEEKPAGERMSDDELVTFRPTVLVSELPKFEAKIPGDIQKKFDELETKMESGELSQKEYKEQERALTLEVDHRETNRREEAREDIAWRKEQAHFLNARPEYMEKTSKGRALFGALSETVATISKEAKFQGVSGIRLLVEADRQVKEAFGIAPTKPKEEKKSEEKPKGKEVVKPPTPIPDVKTLKDAPNAAPNSTDSVYSALDKLSGEAYESALEKLTPEQRAKYEDEADRRSMGMMR